MTDPNTTARTASFWNERHQDPETEAHDNFLIHPLVQAYLSMRAFGDLTGQLQAIETALRDRTKPGDRILSVGCGGAAKERVLAARMPDRRFVAIDIAGEVLDLARATCAEEGITNLTFELADFNALQLEPSSLRAVVGLGAIHHVERLEEFWSVCATGLTSDGVVLAQEYIGANRLQWTDVQIEVGTRALRELVPDKHKIHHETVAPIAVEELIAADPSEAVRSEDILSTCKDAGFSIDAYIGVGCALLQPVLMHQIATFDPQSWEDNHVMSRLFLEEDRLMRAGTLGDDFAMFVATPPG